VNAWEERLVEGRNGPGSSQQDRQDQTGQDRRGSWTQQSTMEGLRWDSTHQRGPARETQRATQHHHLPEEKAVGTTGFSAWAIPLEKGK